MWTRSQRLRTGALAHRCTDALVHRCIAHSGSLRVASTVYKVLVSHPGSRAKDQEPRIRGQGSRVQSQAYRGGQEAAGGRVRHCLTNFEVREPFLFSYLHEPHTSPRLTLFPRLSRSHPFPSRAHVQSQLNHRPWFGGQGSPAPATIARFLSRLVGHPTWLPTLESP